MICMATPEAPILKRAHVGIANGVRGTDVSRAASDLVLGDDSLNTLVDAIEECRITHSNIQVSQLNNALIHLIHRL